MSAAEQWMNRALELAERGRGFVEPNPLVGAVLVHTGRVVGEGWHESFGQAHAEINALKQAGEAARGATLYVTLEPCCHHGKTPPCTDAIIAAGVSRVVAAIRDPFPEVAGGGITLLSAAGIDVETGVGESAARQLNAPYLKLLSTGRPYVHAKWAMTLDGKIATRTGDSKWISSEASLQRVHKLRGRMDGIVVGIATVLADDPLLIARPIGPRIATRIVLDSRGRLPQSSRLVETAGNVPTLIVTCCSSDAALGSLHVASCEILRLPASARIDIPTLLDELGRRRMTNLLVEGGAAVLGSLLDADAIDEFHVFIGPLLVGGSQARPAIGGTGVDRLVNALRLATWEVERIDSDIYIHGWRHSRGAD
jgi:diaminohydroxyphosphoribosylaminopyrimidine deaminase/5-amino-6-(5-phosphoribosylamino)uracil reductase